MSYFAFVDTTGLRDRQSKLIEAAEELRSIRGRAESCLRATGKIHELWNLASIDSAVDFAEQWDVKIADHLADAELGAQWRLFLRMFRPFALSKTQVQELLYFALVEKTVGEMQEDDHASLDEIRDYVYGTPFLSDTQQERYFGGFLAREVEANLADFMAYADDWAPPLAEQLAAGSPELAAAFYESLGPELASQIPMHLHDDDAAALVPVFGHALSDASSLLPDTFGADLILAWDAYFVNMTMIVDRWSQMPPTELFRWGDFDYDFLLNAYDVTEQEYDHTRAYWWSGDVGAVFPREQLLQQIIEHRHFAVTDFLTERRITELLDDGYADDGFLVGSIFEDVGRLSESLAATRRLVGSIVRQIGENGGTLQPFTALGLAVMVDDHMMMFLPGAVINRAGEVGPLREIPKARWHLPRPEFPGISELDKTRFLEVVMRDPQATVVLLDSLARTVHEVVTTRGMSFEEVRNMADELGMLMGRFVDVAGGLAVQQGIKIDDVNAFKIKVAKIALSILISGALSATISLSAPGSAVAIGLGRPWTGAMSKWGLSRLSTELGSLTFDKIWPTDNELKAWRERFDSVVDAPYEEFQYLVVATLYQTSPELFDHDAIPTELLDDGRLLVPTVESSPEFIATWDSWWNSNLLAGVDPQEIADTFSSFRDALIQQSNSDVNGPHLPFTDP